MTFAFNSSIPLDGFRPPSDKLLPELDYSRDTASVNLKRLSGSGALMVPAKTKNRKQVEPSDRNSEENQRRRARQDIAIACGNANANLIGVAFPTMGWDFLGKEDA